MLQTKFKLTEDYQESAHLRIEKYFELKISEKKRPFYRSTLSQSDQM